MKKILLLLLVCLCCCGCQNAGSNKVEPINSSIKKENISGIYPVSFSNENLLLKDDKLYLTVDIYNYDKYSYKDIQQIDVGALITIANNVVEINDLESTYNNKKEKELVKINGGLDVGGYEIVLEKNEYRSRDYNDHPVYYYVDTIEFQISEDIEFIDYWDLESSGTEEHLYYSDFPNALSFYPGSIFNEYNTKIKIENNKITKIERSWIP